MATRSGKVNTIQAGIGVASSRVRLSRNAGLAAVWDWRNDADSDIPGTPIACDIDCAVYITARASAVADFAFRINGVFVTSAGMAIVTVRLIDIVSDQRLFIYQVSVFTSDWELQAIILNRRDALFGERVSVWNSVLREFDTSAEITNVLSKQVDVMFQSHAPRTIYGDILILVPEPTLLTADTLIGVSGVVSVMGDERIAVSKSVQQFTDCLYSIWDLIERWTDVSLAVGKSICLEPDLALRMNKVGSIKGDVVMVISCLVTIAADVRIRTSARLADTDLMQRIYGLLIEESHIIQV